MQKVIYRVKVERKRREYWFEYKYWYDVETEVDGQRNYELNCYGYAKSPDSAKKKVLKHILEVEKDIQKGMKFGVIFTTKGTAEEIQDQLGEHV